MQAGRGGARKAEAGRGALRELSDALEAVQGPPGGKRTQVLCGARRGARGPKDRALRCTQGRQGPQGSRQHKSPETNTRLRTSPGEPKTPKKP